MLKNLIILALIICNSGYIAAMEEPVPGIDAQSTNEPIASIQVPIVKEEGQFKNYSINLTWINNILDPQQPFIFPAKDVQDLKEKYTNYITTWSDLNPQDGGGRVNIWYDSEMTTKEAVAATQKELQDYPIHIRNIRSISLVKDNADIFTDYLPVYFRADLVRAIISWNEIVTGATDYFIFANCNMPPITKEKIFDPETIQNLHKYGLIMGYNCTGSNLSRADVSPFENSFFMLSKDNPLMLESIRKILIQKSIDVARLAVNDANLFKEYNHVYGRMSGNPSPNIILPQFVYEMYGKLYSYYYAKLGQLTLGMHDRIGFKAFGPDIDISNIFIQGSFCVLEKDKIDEFRDLNSRRFRWFIPTKRVSLPPAKKRYYTFQKGNDPSNYR